MGRCSVTISNAPEQTTQSRRSSRSSASTTMETGIGSPMISPCRRGFPPLKNYSGPRARAHICVQGGNGIRVVREWIGLITRRYYELVYHALREADPAALIFADRLPSYYDPDAVRAMAPFVDAVATNYNVDSPDGWIAHYYFDGLRQLTGNKPVLVSEWYFAAHANRSGNLNNGYLMAVQTQAERARGAASAARHFALEPADRRTSLVSILRRAQGRPRRGPRGL